MTYPATSPSLHLALQFASATKYLKQPAHSQRRRNKRVKRPPETIERRTRLDEPVSQLLDDYARFVNRTPDYVTNFALRKMRTRGPEYKRWKTSQAPVAGPKESRTITEQAKTS